MNEIRPKNIPPEILQDYTTHYIKMKYHPRAPEITDKYTFILPLSRKEGYHQPFIELPYEYIGEIIEHQISGSPVISYKTECPCGEIIEFFEI